jgi:hypothetical protein
VASARLFCLCPNASEFAWPVIVTVIEDQMQALLRRRDSCGTGDTKQDPGYKCISSILRFSRVIDASNLGRLSFTGKCRTRRNG